MAAYIAVVVLALREAALWKTGDLKTTLLWSLSAAVAMVIDAGSVAKDELYFKKALRDGFKLSVPSD